MTITTEDRTDLTRVHALLKEASELLGAVFSRHDSLSEPGESLECDTFLAAVWDADGHVGDAAMILIELGAV